MVGFQLEPCSGVVSSVEAHDVDLVGKLKILLPDRTIFFGAEMLLPAGADFKGVFKLWTGPARQTDGLFEIQILEDLLDQLERKILQVDSERVVAVHIRSCADVRYLRRVSCGTRGDRKKRRRFIEERKVAIIRSREASKAPVTRDAMGRGFMEESSKRGIADPEPSLQPGRTRGSSRMW